MTIKKSESNEILKEINKMNEEYDKKQKDSFDKRYPKDRNDVSETVT